MTRARFSVTVCFVNNSALFVAVVDDEESIRHALQRLIQSAGLAVQTFASGADFLVSLQMRRPDCLVLDLHMPLMNGFDIQLELAKMNSRIPVVIITGHDIPGSEALVLSRGARAYLRKPVNDQTLLSAQMIPNEK